MSLWSWAEPRGPAPLSHATRRTPDPVPLCPLCPVFFRNTPYPHCPVEHAHCPRGASPCRPHSRGRSQRGDTPLWGEHPEELALARAPQWLKKTRRLFACTPQLLPQLIAGDELSPRVKTPVAPDESQGWTSVWRDRATRLLGAMPWGRTDRTLLKKALGLLGQVIQHTGDLTLLTDGARREGSRVVARWSDARRNGKRGRPKQTLPTGVKGRRKHTGSHRQKRGPTRPQYPAPSPEHPDTAQPVAPPDSHAHHRAAFPTSLRRRWAASRRRTHMYAKKTGRLQERLAVYWIVPHCVRVHLTTRQVPAVALGMLD
jgi:hypothetical protein